MTLRSRAATTNNVAGDRLPLTTGVLAMTNLQAQIDGRCKQVMAGRLAAVSDQAELIELVALRGQILSRICDYEWADRTAKRLAQEAPTDGAAFMARARSRARFHRFADSFADLDMAHALGAAPAVVDAERAQVLQATGHYEPALTIYNDAAELRADFESLAARATLHAERGEIAAADHFFDQSRDRYQGVSPFPLALLHFQRGLMWQEQGNLNCAHTWFHASVRLLPAYAPAHGHLAVVEAALGKPEAAIERLLPLTTSSDDPQYAASLARVLRETGRAGCAAVYRTRAAARYDELVARHPEAFADHAAEFWLEDGSNPSRALQLARINCNTRQTPKAHELLARASSRTAGQLGRHPP